MTVLNGVNYWFAVINKPCKNCQNKYLDYADRERCHAHCDFIKNLPHNGKCEEYKAERK